MLVSFLQDNRPRKVLSLTIAVTPRDCYLGEIVVIGKVLRKASELSRVLLLNFISRRRNKTPAANSNVNEHGSENISKIHPNGRLSLGLRIFNTRGSRDMRRGIAFRIFLPFAKRSRRFLSPRECLLDLVWGIIAATGFVALSFLYSLNAMTWKMTSFQITSLG